MDLLSDESLSRFRLQQYAGFSVLNQTLVQEDGQLTARGWGAVSGLVSSAICILLYKGTRPFTWALIPGYRKLIIEDRRNWDSRYSSNVHAVLCVYFAWYCLARSDFFWRDDPTPMILRTNSQTYIALGISFGYFAVDFVSCVKYNMGGLEMFLHHLGSLLSVATALVTGDCHMHTLWMLVTEFTTPLINNRWWLDKLEMKETQVYIINGLAILICWMFARLSVFPPFFYIAWKTRDQIALITPLSQVLALIVPIILTTLNLYWFTRIVKGAYKAVFGSPKVKQA